MSSTLNTASMSPRPCRPACSPGFSKYWEDYFTDTTVVTVDWSVNTAELTVSSDDLRPPVPGREVVSTTTATSSSTTLRPTRWQQREPQSMS